MALFVNNDRNFTAANETLDWPEGFSFYGFGTGDSFFPWEISRAEYDGRKLPGVRDILVGLDRGEANEPYLVDRSVFLLDDRPWRQPTGWRYYYIVRLQSECIAHNEYEARRELHAHPPKPARPGEIRAATPNELAMLCRYWSPSPGLTYNELFPIVAIGGPRYAIRSAHSEPLIPMWLKLDTCQHNGRKRTVLEASTQFLPEKVSILVRSRRYF